ncbi:hypothetical protein [Streptomyces sp. DH8]|uniref:hypothetical protein n=1 Tax=Streptomyces sp. DH8 TaxID=2857008 RepID=UPI001E5DB99B|nr:hypothetical protein [Streptomyces sp. DH8]
MTFADVGSRDTGQGYPYREALASCLDCSKQTVDRAAEYLEKEIGLVKIHRRKVEGRPDENDANLYEIFDAWLIHGMTPPKGTPAQLVARYGHVVPGLDVDDWVAEHAPDFDLVGWRAAYDEKVRAQAAKREEQRRKERARRKKSKKGGDVMGDATPEGPEGEGGSVMGDASGDVIHDASGGVVDDALSRAGVPEPSSAEDDAPSGRSPVGGRSPSTSGSSRARGEGGSAASGKTSSSPTPKSTTRGTVAGKAKSGSKKAAHSREQLDVVRRVRAFFPPELLDHGLPDLPVVSSAILTAMGEGRTVEQMRDRIWFRWANHGFSDIWAEDGRFEKPVGVAVALVRPLRRGDRFACPDLRCENGVSLDTGEPCRLCAERLADWRAERARKRGQTPRQGSNSAPTGAGSDDTVLPPQRAAQDVPAARSDVPVELDDAVDAATAGLPWWEVEAARYEQTLAGREQHDPHPSPAPF